MRARLASAIIVCSNRPRLEAILVLELKLVDTLGLLIYVCIQCIAMRLYDRTATWPQ